jgi:hypothetical protein
MSETTRTEVTDAVACPACGAELGEPCRGVERRDGSRRPRKRLHAERWKAAGAAGAAGTDDRRRTRNRRLEAVARLERERRDLEAIARLREVDGDASRTAPLSLGEQFRPPQLSGRSVSDMGRPGTVSR